MGLTHVSSFTTARSENKYLRVLDTYYVPGILLYLHYIISFWYHSYEVEIKVSFYTWGNWDSQRLNNLMKNTVKCESFKMLTLLQQTPTILLSVQFSSVQSLSRVQLCDPMTAAHEASLSITKSKRLLKLMFIELVMPSNHLILCCPVLLLPSSIPSIRVFSNVSSLHQVAKVLEFQLQHQSFQWIFRTHFL